MEASRWVLIVKIYYYLLIYYISHYCQNILLFIYLLHLAILTKSNSDEKKTDLKYEI